MKRTKTRDHHYVFAHRLLPQMFFSNPEDFVGAFVRHQADFLHFLWKLARGRGIKAILNQVSAKGLQHGIKKLDDETTVVLIVLPQPKRCGEAFFVAAIHRPRTRDSLPTRGGALARYMTLEYGFNLDSSPRTVLCEWTTSDKWHSNIRHINYGDGPEPTLDTFFEAVCSLVKGELNDYGQVHAVAHLGTVDEDFETDNM